jgi:hypothetical protein
MAGNTVIFEFKNHDLVCRVHTIILAYHIFDWAIADIFLIINYLREKNFDLKLSEHG